jgi:hypothetical protein
VHPLSCSGFSCFDTPYYFPNKLIRSTFIQSVTFRVLLHFHLLLAIQQHDAISERSHWRQERNQVREEVADHHFLVAQREALQHLLTAQLHWHALRDVRVSFAERRPVSCNRILRDVCLDVARVELSHLDVVLRQLSPQSFSKAAQRKLRRSIECAHRQAHFTRA